MGKFHRVFAGLAAGLSMLAFMPSASAMQDGQTISDSMSAEEIDAMLRGAGFSTTLMSDRNSGAPVAVATVGQVQFVVRALDCEGNPPSCAQLLFFANFDLGRPTTGEDYKVVNDFNDSSYEGRAYVLEDSGEIGVDFIIDLTGGVTSAHIQSRLSRWQGIISGFLAEMRAARTSS